jgi:hypothetical protein
MKSLIKIAFMLLPFSVFAQSEAGTVHAFIAPYAGLTQLGAFNSEQTGTAHKRGNYNEFETDFDLQVKVNGKSKSALGYSYGATLGSTWMKAGRKLNPGIEMDLFLLSASHSSELVNSSTELVSNVVGPNPGEVEALVEEHYGAGHHSFSNSMTMTSWNAATNLTLNYGISTKVSLCGALGAGFTAVSMNNAESLQSSPAPANAGFETTADNGGGAVNHFNGNPSASDNMVFSQFRIGVNMQMTKSLAISLNARGMLVGRGEFIFGSTKYSDHAPTDNWTYRIESGFISTLTAGVSYTL